MEVMSKTEYWKSPAGKMRRKIRYADTITRCTRAYQKRTRINKTITVRLGEEDGRAISIRTQAGLNIVTEHVSVSCAIWYCRAIYPSTTPGRTTCDDV